MHESLWYAYGLVSAERPLTGAPTGVDGGSVELVAEGPISVLVSEVDGERYAPAVVEPALADVTWLGPRAAAHDAVLLWAAEEGAVIPLPLFTLFSGRAALAAMLRARAAEAVPLLERLTPVQEFGVRIFRDPAVLDAHLGELSPRLFELAEQMRTARPGQRYLLQRKVAAERGRERDRVSSEVAQSAMAALSPHAAAAVREPLPALTAGEGEGTGVGTAVLNAYFLISREEPGPFRAALTDFAARHEPLGFRVQFTGPWPPYHFTRSQA